jgi:PHD/YefM family antitoxin component YafN of YafNO toxin-antitoxin module
MLRQETTNYSEFRDNFEGEFQRMSKASVPTAVLRSGKAAAYVLSPREFRAYAIARERVETLEAITESMAQFEAGKGIPWEDAKARLRQKFGGARPNKRKKGSHGSR